MAETSLGELLDRLTLLEDERKIVATLYRYGDALDHGDREAFLDCFTPDASYEVRMRIDGSNDFVVTGHDELGAYFDGHTHAPAAYHKHITVNPAVTCAETEAQSVAYFLRVDSPAMGPATVLAAGRYIDRLERGDDGVWRLRSRRCEVENL